MAHGEENFAVKKTALVKANNSQLHQKEHPCVFALSGAISTDFGVSINNFGVLVIESDGPFLDTSAERET
jgi:hypothetical protein